MARRRSKARQFAIRVSSLSLMPLRTSTRTFCTVPALCHSGHASFAVPAVFCDISVAMTMYLAVFPFLFCLSRNPWCSDYFHRTRLHCLCES